MLRYDPDAITTLRLEHLIETLKTVKVQGLRFDMRDWITRTDCGTACCAAGWACFSPNFRAQGLQMEDDLDQVVETPTEYAANYDRMNSDYPDGDNYSAGPVYKGHGGFRALEMFFGPEARRIFDAEAYFPADTSLDVVFRHQSEITPDQVIVRIREVLDNRRKTDAEITNGEQT